MSTERKLMTVKQVMTFLSCSRTWVYDAAARGELPCLRLGSMLRFDPEQIDEWLRSRRQRAAVVMPLRR